jgi:hypothetical protein
LEILKWFLLEAAFPEERLGLLPSISRQTRLLS